MRAGHHFAQPVLRRFGQDATLRPSLAFYNTPEEVDRKTAVVQRLARHWVESGRTLITNEEFLGILGYRSLVSFYQHRVTEIPTVQIWARQQRSAWCAKRLSRGSARKTARNVYGNRYGKVV